MNRTLTLAALSLAFAASAQADVLTQWNFNSVPPDASTNTGSTAPSIGAGTATLLGVTGTFASGAAGIGSSDPATVDDSGWQTTSYPVQGVGSQTRGTQYLVSTVGFQDVSLSFDLRFSNTSSKFGTVLYTVNGTNWLNLNPAVLFSTASGDTWVNGTTVDFSNVAGVNNNASFGVRIVSTFQPSTSNYAPATASNTYGSGGTWRFDMVTVSAAPIPEPGTWALMLAGLVGVGVLARRRQA